MLRLVTFVALASVSLAELSKSTASSGTDIFYKIFSDSSNYAVGPDLLNGGPAVPTYSGNGGWTASIPGATWIWDSSQVSSPGSNQVVTITNSFFAPCNIVSATLVSAADNSLAVTVNGAAVASAATNTGTYATPTTSDISSLLIPGLNKIQFVVTNIAVGGSNYQTNPGGVLYAISIHAQV
jgi:hypothetical protein